MKLKKMIFALVAAGVLGAAGYGLYWFGMHRGMKMSTPMPDTSVSMPTPISVPSTDKKVLYWHDPMVPAQKFDKPGKSPFMDMQLVPVYANDTGNEGTVSISPRVQQNLGIRTAEVTRGSLETAVVAVGSVAYNERDVVVVTARSNGFVERVYVRAPLDTVRKGQALAELYVPEWVAAQEEYFSVKRMQGSGLEALIDGARQRMRLAGMNDEQIRLVEASGKVQARSTITAPIGGVMAELPVREGMTVMAGASLFRINGLGTIWVNADIPENISALVRPGIAVEARTPSLVGTVFKGKVSAILPEVNTVTRTLKARIELANPSGQLVPGMFATINFISPARQNVLLAPTEAVIQTGTRSVVMVAQSDGTFGPLDVETGMEANGRTEIRKGLEAGQKVVVSGQFLIDSEASLKGTSTRMSGVSGVSGMSGMGDMQTQGAGKAGAATHRGEGKIESIDKDGVTLSHGPIPSLQWGPMTMGFKASVNNLPKNIAVGDSVSFEFRTVKEGVFEIISMSRIAGAPMPDAKGKATSGPAKGDMRMPADKAGMVK